MQSTMMMYVLPMILGQTYHLGKEKVGIPLFSKEETQKAETLKQYFTDYQYKMVQNADEVKDFLDISGKLSLKIKGDMVAVSGAGSYLKDSSSKSNGLEILIRLHFETVTKTLRSTAKPMAVYLDYEPEYLGTHYCRSITYGGDLIASVRISATNTYDLEKIKGSIEGAIKTQGFAAEVKAGLEMLQQNAQDSSSMEINYYATVPLKGVSYTVDGLMELVKSFPEQVSAVNNGLGNPLRMELYPLGVLKTTIQPYIQNRALTGLLSDLEDEFDDLRATRKAVANWILELPPDVTLPAVQEVTTFSDLVNNIYGKYMQTIADLDVSDKAPLKPLTDAQEAYKNNEYIMPEKYMRQFRKLQLDIYEKYPELKPKIGGALFTRWGRKDCLTDKGTEAVVSGVAAGSEGSQLAGSSEYLCLPLSPEFPDPKMYFPNYDASADENAERDIVVSPLKYTGEITPKFVKMKHKNMACARCRATFRTSVVMMPGRDECPNGFTLEYKGILMAPGENAPLKASYICVDEGMEDPEGDPVFGSESIVRWPNVKEVTADCESLRCGTQSQDKVIPCVVCTI